MNITVTDQTITLFHQLIAEVSPDLHTVTTTDGVYVFASGVGLALFGWGPEDVVGQSQDALVHPDDMALVQAARARALGSPVGSERFVYRLRCADGAYRWAETISRMVEVGDQRLVVSSVRDIGERQASQLELQRQATTDPLTGLANRTLFMDRFEQALRRLDRAEGVMAVLFLDLDRFKLVNDSFGHHTGDAVLVGVAERLCGLLRPEDTLARVGGDEFVVVAEGLAWPSEATALGRRIIEIGHRPFPVGGMQVVCTTSVGIAVTTDSHRKPSDLLQEADRALYRAKQRGRDRSVLFKEDLLKGRMVGHPGVLQDG